MRYVLLMLSLLLLLCGCGGAEVSAETTGLPETTASPLPPIDLSAGYTIVRPEEGDALEIDAAVRLYRAFDEAGVEIRLGTDWVKREEDIPTDTPEILIGATNRAETLACADGLLSEDYVIAVRGKRVVILGGTAAATSAAVDAFIDRYMGGETPTLPADLLFGSAGHYAATLTIAGRPAADFCIVVPQNGDRYLTYAADLLAEAIEDACGATLSVVRDSEVEHACEIRLGRTARGGRASAAVSFDGTSMCLGQSADDSAEVVRIVRGLIACNLTDLADGTVIALDDKQEVRCTLDIPQTAVHPDLVGKRAVALTDQKNACVAVVDLDAADPTEKSALIWEWRPTAAAGFALDGYANSIDEAKLCYDSANGRWLVCVTSSAGFFGVATYPEGECVWNGCARIGPHSIAWLPNGNVAVASSGNSNTANGGIRIYAASQGKNNAGYAEVKLESAHGVVWDDTLGVLWALGADVVCAYRIGGTDAAPTITEVTTLRAKMPHAGGHDLQADPCDPDVLWVSGKNVLRLDKKTGKYDADFSGAETVNSGSIKAFGNFADGVMVRAKATKVYKDHDTDTLVWFVPGTDGVLSQQSAVFSDRAFYKARIWTPEYGG